MAYPVNRHVRDAREISQNIQRCQGKIIENVQSKEVGRRLLVAFKEALGIEDKAEIARILGYKTEQSVYKIIKGEQELSFAGLVRFRNSTKRSIDWLLTGEGEPGGTLDEMLPEAERAVVRRIAEIYQLDVEVVVKDLLDEALLARGAHAWARYTHLHEDQREEMDAIYSLLLRESSTRRQTAPKNRA